MRNPTLALGAIACFAVSAAAQTLTAPAAFANAEAGNSGNIWRGGLNRVQCFYDSSNFTSQNQDVPLIINNLEWRANGAATGVTVNYPSVELWLGYSANDFLVPSTTFATNRTASHTLVYSGPVTVNPPAGTTPNSFHINVPLTMPFTYDPSLGQDLLLEIVILAAPTPTTLPLLSCAFNTTVHFANSIRSVGSTVATAGSASAFAPVVRFTYTEPVNPARRPTYGTGCDQRIASLYENFNPGTAFDLDGSVGVTNSILLTPNSSGGYTVTPGSNGWFTPVGSNLALGDDAVSVAQALPFSFPFPGGTTSGIYVGSNGYVFLAATGAAAATGTAAAFLAEGPRLSAYWTDLDPSATGTGTIVYDPDAANGAAYVTWTGVPMWEAAPSTPRFLNTFQIALFANGTVELRYQDCAAPTYNIITGFSAGAAQDPGNRDISAVMPFSTTMELRPLGVNATARPIIGNTIGIATTNIPAGALISANLLSFTQQNPGLDLTGLGMPGCFQYINMDNTTILIGSGTQTRQLSIPTSIAWPGLKVFSQSASLVPGVNPLGALSSNGLELELGSN